MSNNYKKQQENIIKKTHCLYFVDDVLVEEKVECKAFLKFLYQNKFGRFLRSVLSCSGWASSLYGLYQNSRLSKRKIKEFVKKHSINMNDFECPTKGFGSFNDFFCRKLKQDARPIESSKIISPVDGKLLVLENISHECSFFIKNHQFNLEKFLNDEVLAQQYAHGTFLLFRLAPYDYHRFHFPVAGVPRLIKKISGKYESVNPLVYLSGIQPLTENLRYIIALDTQECETILMIPVGAMMVGSVVQSFEDGKEGKKGDEAGYFQFGGSSLVLLFKPGVMVVQKKFLEHSLQGYETAVTMGQAISEV